MEQDQKILVMDTAFCLLSKILKNPLSLTVSNVQRRGSLLLTAGY